MAKYIRKPVIVDAAQWFPEVGRSIRGVYPGPYMNGANVGDGDLVISGDWCVTFPDGHIEVYSPEEFKGLFEEVFPA